MEWDTAAGQCIAEEAGASVTDLYGQRLRYNKPNLLNPEFMVDGASLPWQEWLGEPCGSIIPPGAPSEGV
jgi:3'(2'), 5'-bisphosphate nucleotidase